MSELAPQFLRIVTCSNFLDLQHLDLGYVLNKEEFLAEVTPTPTSVHDGVSKYFGREAAKLLHK